MGSVQPMPRAQARRVAGGWGAGVLCARRESEGDEVGRAEGGWDVVERGNPEVVAEEHPGPPWGCPGGCGRIRADMGRVS